MRLVSFIAIMVGIILIYDAREITEKAFSFGDQNEGALGLKVTGYILSLVRTNYGIYFYEVI